MNKIFKKFAPNTYGITCNIMQCDTNSKCADLMSLEYVSFFLEALLLRIVAWRCEYEHMINSWQIVEECFDKHDQPKY